MKVKVFPDENLGRYLDIENYTSYPIQNLPKPQKNSKYMVLTEGNWLQLYYIEGKFYFPPNQKRVTPYFKWELWQDENTILKGEPLQTVNNRFLSKEGRWLKIAYQFWKITRDYSRESKKLFKAFKNENNQR